LVGPKSKAASVFTDVTTQYRDNRGAAATAIIAAADVCVSDFGEYRIVASRSTVTARPWCSTWSTGAPPISGRSRATSWSHELVGEGKIRIDVLLQIP
jgi:hypothetical protein